MATRVQKKRVSIELGDGVFIDVDIKPVLSGTSVPKPPPKASRWFCLRPGQPQSPAKNGSGWRRC